MEASSHPWLFPGVDRAEAESLLDRREDGTFLIRGSNTGGYALSIVNQKHVYHYRILLNEEKRLHIKVKQQDIASTFGSLDDLVAYYSTTGAGLVHMLAHPAGIASDPREVEPATPPPAPEQQQQAPPTQEAPPTLPTREEIVDEKWKFLEACRLGNVEDVNSFLRAGVVDVNATDSTGLSGLHWASLKGHTQVAESLLYGGAFPNLEDNMGHTPLLKSCMESQLDVVKLLVVNGSMLNHQSKDGCTPLHVACGRGMVEVVKHLLTSGADPTVENNDGNTPLHTAALAGHLACVQELLVTPDVDPKVWNNRDLTPEKMVAGEGGVVEWLRKYKPNPSYREYSRVIVCGSAGSGKTTLTQCILASSKSTLLRAKMKFGFGDTTKHPTAGIVCHTVQSLASGVGDVLLYDLAGEERYHSMHYAYFHTLSSHSPSTFVIALNLMESNEEMTRHLFYWCSFIDCLCHACPKRSSVIVVGTNGDKIKSKALGNTCTIVKQIAQCALKRETFADLVTTQSGEEVGKFATLLQKTVEGVVERTPFVSTRAVSTLGFAKKVLPEGCVAMTVSYLHLHMMNESLPFDAHRVLPLLRSLSRKGLILLLEREDVAFDGTVVVGKEALLEKVVGAVFALPNSTIGNSAGIITLQAFKKYFPNLDIDVIVDFLTHFELCLQIYNVQPHLPRSEPEFVLFFPDLINEEKASDVIAHDDSFGWSMLTGTQFYTRYFFCVLVLRLVQRFSLLRVKSAKEPSIPLCPQCEFWSNGVFWVTCEGISVIVEMKDCNQLYVNVSPLSKVTTRCLAEARSVIALVKKTFSTLCPSVIGKEFVELRYNSSPTLVLLSALVEALKRPEQYVLDSNNKKVLFSNWKSMIPQLLQLCSDISALQ